MKTIKLSLWDDVIEAHPEIMTTRQYTYLPLDIIHSTKLYFGKELRTNDLCIMFLSKKDLYTGKQFPSAEGFEVRIDFFQNSEGKDGIVLKLINNDYSNVFVSLVNDLLTNLSETGDEESFVETFISRLSMWKMFLKNDSLQAMGIEKQKGLFGELHFLDRFLLPIFNADALKYWSGPLMATHDFEIGQEAVEVKTTSGNAPELIHISNEKQLNNDGYDTLYIYKVSISCRKNSNPTLPEFIDSIRNKLTHPKAIFTFNDLLMKYGYHDINRDLYRNDGFHVDIVNLYKVEEGFPRILKKDLLPGVGTINYTVDVSSIEKFKVNDSIFIASLKEKK